MWYFRYRVIYEEEVVTLVSLRGAKVITFIRMLGLGKRDM